MANLKSFTKLSRLVNRTGLRLKKHSPELLIIGGIIGVVSSTVMACKATRKLDGVLDEHKHEIAEINIVAEELTDAKPEEVKAIVKKEVTKTYARTGVELVKLYGPSVVLGAASIVCIVGSHKIMKRRNVALAAAYNLVDKGFKDYRANVVERFGKDLDRELRYNLKAKEIEERIVDENGNETIEKHMVEVSDNYTPSEFSFFFDETCSGWCRNAEDNKFFLLQQEADANKRLQSRGHLFLNEVLDMLGAQRTKAGAQVGWIYDEDNPHVNNYVDFGVFIQRGNEVYDERKRAFVNGHEQSVLIDPNVDGVIYDLLP